MNKRKILVTGAGGQLGRDLARAFAPLNVELIGPSSREMDIREIDAVAAVFEAVRPELVLHCAAYNQVDLAEKEPEACRAVNVRGTGNVAALSRDFGAYMLAISSDYVFDGTKPAPYETDDPRSPLSVYGASKAEGEDIVLQADAGNAVIRTSWLFGPREHNFVEAILRKGRESAEISVVRDQIGSPTYTADLAELILACAEQRVPGLLHGTNEGFCSRAEFAETILRDAGIACAVREILSEELPDTARRPKNSRLEKRCLDRLGLRRLPAWQEALERYLKRIII